MNESGVLWFAVGLAVGWLLWHGLSSTAAVPVVGAASAPVAGGPIYPTPGTVTGSSCSSCGSLPPGGSNDQTTSL